MAMKRKSPSSLVPDTGDSVAATELESNSSSSVETPETLLGKRRNAPDSNKDNTNDTKENCSRKLFRSDSIESCYRKHDPATSTLREPVDHEADIIKQCLGFQVHRSDWMDILDDDYTWRRFIERNDAIVSQQSSSSSDQSDWMCLLDDDYTWRRFRERNDERVYQHSSSSSGNQHSTINQHSFSSSGNQQSSSSSANQPPTSTNSQVRGNQQSSGSQQSSLSSGNQQV